ncbi:hypothetical protein [Carboxylicivirga marina]|uniref:hypothetical protein n=1 Tax=Carboxylicivirga marina TaxID=2800988 RepID=UPI00259A920D|nr:hypothetical protein [uncultured Carboxylicivirga sp.]
MALILRDNKIMNFHTDLYEIIEPFKDNFRELNWLLTEQEYILLDYEQKGKVEKLNHDSKKIEFTGDELYETIKNREIQFIWGVFCGFNGTIPDLVVNELPYADLNPDIWKRPDKKLVKGSVIEIICFDSSSTILKTKNNKIKKLFGEKFPEAIKMK